MSGTMPDELSHEYECVRAFHLKFGLPLPDTPQPLTHHDAMYRLYFLHEELNETLLAYSQQNMEKFFDGLLDLVYVAIGTAIWAGLPWKEGWDAVHQANMMKIRVKQYDQSKRKSHWDIVKPHGWKAPDLLPILRKAGWNPQTRGEA